MCFLGGEYMDTALELRIANDSGNIISNEQVESLLNSSGLVHKLTLNFERKPLYAIWRIIALSEIPYSQTLEYTNQVIEYIEKYMATPSGFTLTGKANDFVPCYNAMLIEAYSKLGIAKMQSVQNAVEWIKRYQPFERNSISVWSGNGVKKYGGCLKSTPCFLGIVKTVKALVAYDKAIAHEDAEVLSMISKGMDYILKHELYKRISNKEPINKHMLDLAFPASYQVNIVELLELAFQTGNIKNENCKSAIDHINSKKSKDGYWKINYVYKADGYLPFDKRGQKAEWLTYLLENFTNGV